MTIGDLVADGGAYTASITLSEAAGAGTALEVSDLQLDNATATLSGSGTSYVATLTPLADGVVGLSVPHSSFTDAADNPNTTSNTVQVTHTSVGDGASSASQGGIGFAWGEKLQTGQFPDGPLWVVKPSGNVSVAEPTPSETTDNGMVVHGAMLNPVVEDQAQGFDERETTGRWDAASRVTSWPVSMSAGDVLVKAVSKIPGPAADRDGNIDEYATLFILDTAPSANALSPIAFGWSGRSSTDPINFTTSIAAFVAGLPEYATSTYTMPTYTEIMERLDFWMPHWAVDYHSVDSHENLSPSDIWGVYNWGGNINKTFQMGALALICDRYTAAQKRAITIRLCSIGAQIYGPAAGANFSDPYYYEANGGIHQFHLSPVAIYLHLTGQTAALASLLNDIPGNFGGAFRVTPEIKATFAPHDRADYPSYSRRRTVASISGNAITFEGFVSAFESYRQIYTGLLLTNGTVSSQITAMPDFVTGTAPDALTATVADATGFATSNEIWTVSPHERKVGEYDWSIWEAQGRLGGYIPSPDADYRSLNDWSGHVLFLKAAGILHPNWKAVEKYTEQSNTPNFPAADFDWPASHFNYVSKSASYTSFCSAFWDDHWNAIKNVPQAYSSVPDFFGEDDFTVATGSGPSQIDITISKVPDDNGSAITALQYRLDGGTWTALSGTVVATYTVDAPAAGISYTVELRAANANGETIPSSAITVTSGAAASASNLVQNPEFETSDDWVLTTPWSISGGVAVMSGSGAFDAIRQSSITVTGGVEHEARFDFAAISNGTGNYLLRVTERNGANNGTQHQANQPIPAAPGQSATVTFTPAADCTEVQVQIFALNNAAVFSIDNVYLAQT